MSAPSLDSWRDKEGNSILHLYSSENYPALMLKMMKRKDVPSPHKAFLKTLRQDKQWLINKDQLQELIKRGCNPNATNAKGETPISLIWERYKKIVEGDHKLSGSAPPGKKERGAMALLKEVGALFSSKANQECLQLTWSILQRMRQSGKAPPVFDPNLVLDMTPMRLLLMCSPKEQSEVIRSLIDNFKITQPPLNPILTFDIIFGSGTLLHPDVMEMGTLVSLLKSVHQMSLDRPDAARHFWEPRRKHLTDLVRMYAGGPACTAVRAHDPGTGSTPLHYAIRLDMEDIVSLCFKHQQADETTTDASGCTPLLLALDKLKDKTLLMGGRPGAIVTAKALAASSRSITIADRHGMTPLLAVVSALATLGLKYRGRQAYAILARHLPEATSVPVGKESSAVGYCIEADLAHLLKELAISRVPGLGLKQANSEGMTPLHMAGLLGRYEIARVLVSSDQSLCNQQDRSGNTPLFYLVSSLRPGQCLDMIRNYQALWDFGIKNNRFETVFDYYMVKATDDIHSPGIQDVLHTLVSASGAAQEVAFVGNLRRDPKLFQSMSVATGKKVGIDEPMRNIRDLVRDLNDLNELFQSLADRSRSHIDAMINGKTAAMICASQGLEDELHYLQLVTMGDMNINIQDPDGRTALHHAGMTDNVDCFQVITMVPNVDLNLADRNGNSALFYVVEYFPPSEILRLVKQLPWDFTMTNYTGRNIHAHYLNTLGRPNDAVANALRKVCSSPAGTKQSGPVTEETVSRSPQQKPRELPATSPRAIPPAPPASSPPESEDTDGSPGPIDPNLLRRRPTVGQLANHLEGMIRRPKRGSLVPGERSPAPDRRSGDVFSYSSSPEGGHVRSREERGSTSRVPVQRFSYLESADTSGPTSPTSPPLVIPKPSFRSSSFKSLGSPPPYSDARSNHQVSKR